MSKTVCGGESVYMTMNLVTMPWFLANSAERRALKVYLLIDNFCVKSRLKISLQLEEYVSLTQDSQGRGDRM